MALGLSGLTIALFMGVMAFAISTSPAERANAAGEHTSLGPVLESTRHAVLHSLSFARPRLAVEPTSVSVVPVNQQALLATRVDDLEVSDSAVVARDEGPSPVEATTAQVVTVQAASPTDTPALAVGDRVQATVSFYYCERGASRLHAGDGGKFCGIMRDGDVVYPGAAACAYEYLGQRFRIAGDPLAREYTCADTGSAVHGLHRDIWFMTSDEGWAWQLDVGQTATIEIVP